MCHLSSPNFETKHQPTAQLDTACNTSASCCIAAADMTTADSVTAEKVWVILVSLLKNSYWVTARDYSEGKT
jgi:hypothetical protein